MALGIKGLSYDYLPEDPWSKSELLLASKPTRCTRSCPSSSTPAGPSASRSSLCSTLTTPSPATATPSSPPSPTAAPSPAFGLPTSTTSSSLRASAFSRRRSSRREPARWRRPWRRSGY